MVAEIQSGYLKLPVERKYVIHILVASFALKDIS